MQMHYEWTRSTNLLHQGKPIKQPFVLLVCAMVRSSGARALPLPPAGSVTPVSTKPVGCCLLSKGSALQLFSFGTAWPGSTKPLLSLTPPDRYAERSEPVCDGFAFYYYCSNSYAHYPGNNRGFVNGLWLFILYRQSKKEGEKFNHFSSNLYETAAAYHRTTSTIAIRECMGCSLFADILIPECVFLCTHSLPVDF